MQCLAYQLDPSSVAMAFLCALVAWRGSLNMTFCRLAGAPAGWRRLAVVRVAVVGMMIECGVVGMDLWNCLIYECGLLREKEGEEGASGATAYKQFSSLRGKRPATRAWPARASGPGQPARPARGAGAPVRALAMRDGPWPEDEPAADG